MRSRRRTYLGLFGLVFVVLAASLAVCYLERAAGWFTPRVVDTYTHVGIETDSIREDTNGTGTTSLFNVGITVILFILLAFSILNIYSFFNAQMDKEKEQLGESVKSVDTQIGEARLRLGALEDRQSADYLYERSFQRLVSDSCPIYVRAAAAGHFLENRPRDTDLEILKGIRAGLPADDEVHLPLIGQLDEVIETWDQVDSGGG